MKIKVPTVIEETVAHIKIDVPINYDEEEIPNDFPLRTADRWTAFVNIDTGKIDHWPEGKTADIHLTVKDSGSYFLFASDGRIVAKIVENYVPHGIVPGSYGDTVELKIAADGVITNWPSNPDARDFFARE